MKDIQPSVPESVRFAYESAKSLFGNDPTRVGVIYRPTYEANARTPECMPLNVDDEILSGLIQTVRERHIPAQLSFKPYWNKNIVYDPIEVFGATVQSFDLHDAPLPRTVLPPEKDVARFIEAVKERSYKVKLTEQLNTALNITDNNLMGAVNLCWIATRFMGRGADQRVYPGIYIDENDVRAWNNQLAQFETYTTSGKNDAPGDNYYFWTHVFGAMVFSKPGVASTFGQVAFSKGTQIMEFVRREIARKQPNITNHEPASSTGRAIGLMFANLDESVLV